MLEENRKIRDFGQLQIHMIKSLEQVLLPAIFSYPERPQSHNNKALKIEVIQREGLMILKSIIADYPGWEVGYELFNAWDNKTIKFLNKLNISKYAIEGYRLHEVKDIEDSATNKSSGLEDLFMLFHIQVNRLEKIRLILLGIDDVSELRGKVLHDINMKGQDIVLRNPDDMIALAKYESRLLEEKANKDLPKPANRPAKKETRDAWLEIGKRVNNTKRNREKENLAKTCSLMQAIAIVAAEQKCSASKVREAWYYYRKITKNVNSV
jgi:hypothetical protein